MNKKHKIELLNTELMSLTKYIAHNLKINGKDIHITETLMIGNELGDSGSEFTIAEGEELLTDDEKDAVDDFMNELK